MNTIALERDDVVAYLDRVRLALADLPPEEREGLLADVEASVREAAGESSEPVATLLGPPEAFAADLRSAAGFPPAPPATREGALARARGRLAAIGEELSDFAPLWWVLRAYLAIALVAMILGSSWYYRVGLIPVLHSRDVTEAVFAGALVLSLWLGRRRDRWMRGVDLLLVVAIIPVAVQLSDNYARSGSAVVADSEAGAIQVPPSLSYGDRQVENVYAYDRAGRLLHDVRLYDDLGRPLNVGGRGDTLRRYVRGRGGRVALNAFPIRYFEQGTRRVARPNAAPRARVAPVVTPPARRAPQR